ncbi:MAG: YbhB/YbcL family Raf kinase inhibitor-like protein [Beijerinckiaceae bacterium]|jgi:Raf kinase inhibitor-like YbhB/YbcL family protein
MRLNSSAFSDGGAIPRHFTCDGENVSPPLHWSNAPAGTLSFALLCDDPDAPSGTWHHWAAYDVPVNHTTLPEGAGRPRGGEGFKQALNDFGKAAYGGPCPPHGDGLHHYHFRLLALSTGHLEVGTDPSCLDVEQEARKHLLAESVLVAVYRR